MPDAVDVKHMLVLASEFSEELAEQGRDTTAQVSGALTRVVERGRRRSDEVRETLVGGLRRRVGVVWSWAARDVAGDRQRVGAQVAAVVDELVALSRRQHDEVREWLGVAAERTLQSQALLTQAVAEVAALSRAQHEVVCKAFETTTERESATQSLLTQVAVDVEALARQHECDARVLSQCANQELEALGRLTDAIAQAAALSGEQHHEVYENLQETSRQQLHALTLVTESIERIAATRPPSPLTVRDRLRDALGEESEPPDATPTTTPDHPQD